jgi:phosphoribosylformylglycinamidine synthase
MKFGVVVFPGSNCDHDAYHVFSKHVGQPVDFIWHKETNLNGFDAVIVPGGFSYGDYLRAGALARFSPVMNAVKKFAADGSTYSVYAMVFRSFAKRGCCQEP